MVKINFILEFVIKHLNLVGKSNMHAKYRPLKSLCFVGMSIIGNLVAVHKPRSQKSWDKKLTASHFSHVKVTFSI